MTTLSDIPSGAAAARLARRAQAVVRLRHPNLVRMLQLPGGAGLSPVLGSAHPLSDFTLPSGTFKRFDLEQVVRLLIDVLSGVSALHEVVVDGESFAHGAIAPRHIYIDEHGTARLVPLLPTHFSTHAQPERTGYVAPECLLGRPATARSDVFSVGVMLWEALSGIRLCPEGAEPALGPDRRPPAIRLSPRLRWAEPLCAIAERAIAFEPAERFASAVDLSRAMEGAAARELSRVDTGAWQDEAPTPVFQPGLHMSALRTLSPPPTVHSVRAEPPKLPPAALEHESLQSAAVPKPRQLRRLQFGALALAALSALLLVLPRSHVGGRGSTSAAPVAAVPALAPERALPARPAPSAVPPPAAVSVTSEPEAAAPRAAVVPLATTAPSSSGRAATPTAVPRAAAPGKGRPSKPASTRSLKPQAPHDDYGI